MTGRPGQQRALAALVGLVRFGLQRIGARVRDVIRGWGCRPAVRGGRSVGGLPGFGLACMLRRWGRVGCRRAAFSPAMVGVWSPGRGWWGGGKAGVRRLPGAGTGARPGSGGLSPSRFAGAWLAGASGLRGRGVAGSRVAGCASSVRVCDGRASGPGEVSGGGWRAVRSCRRGLGCC